MMYDLLHLLIAITNKEFVFDVYNIIATANLKDTYVAYTSHQNFAVLLNCIHVNSIYRHVIVW